MADYSPVFLPGQTFTSQASGTIVGGDPVEVSGSGTVAKCAGASSVKYVGVAAHDATSGQKVTVIANKVVHDGVAEGAITAGDELVPSNAAGKTVKSTGVLLVNQDVGATPTQATINAAVNAVVASLNLTRAVIGVAMTTAVDGGTVRWLQV